MPKKRLDEMDTNKDGSLSLDKFKAGRKMRAFHRHGPPAEAPATPDKK